MLNEDAGRRGMKLDMKLAECFRELNAGDWNEAHVALYAKYFDMNAVEKAFYDLKNEQDAKRLGTHSAKAMDGKLFTLFISSILISEIRRRMDGFDGQWTLNSIRTSLDKITFSKVKIEHLKKAKELKGLVSKTQREYLAKLLECLPYEAADELFSIQIS